MQRELSIVKIISCGAIVLFLFPGLTHAYIDPGTGSYIFQVAGAALLASLFFIKSALRGAKVFLDKLFARKAAPKMNKKDGNQ